MVHGRVRSSARSGDLDPLRRRRRGARFRAWPELRAPEWYDPKTHSPAQPIPREPLAPDAPEVIAVRNQILSAPGTRHLDSGWMVDYAARGLVRLPHPGGSAARVRERAARDGAGLGPGGGAGRARARRRFPQKSFEAFGHAYTDRWGGVYPGVTLFDAQASALVYQVTVEMPDAGLARPRARPARRLGDVEGAGARRGARPLYSRLGDLLRPILHHRGLRAEPRAHLRMCGNAGLRDNYANNLDNFHALWESVSSRPDDLRAKLPDAEGGATSCRAGTTPSRPTLISLYRAARRHATLDRDAHLVRATMFRLLGEYGAFTRIEKLPPFDQ